MGSYFLDRQYSDRIWNILDPDPTLFLKPDPDPTKTPESETLV